MVQQAEVVSTAASSKKGKKRARGYEGDEVFKVGRTVLCPSSEDREIILASLDGEKSQLIVAIPVFNILQPSNH